MTTPATSRRTPRKSEEGIALILVLMLILLLSAIVVDYSYEVQVEAALTARNRDDLQAYVAAKSAVASGLGLLQQDIIERSMMGQAGQAANQAMGAASGATSTAQPKDLSPSTPTPTPTTPGLAAPGVMNAQGQMAGDFDALTSIWAQPMPPTPMNEATMTCHIDDECGKINLNALVDPNGRENAMLIQTLRALFRNMGIDADADPVDAILDWVDFDSDPREKGAESDNYSGGDVPYTCKNGPMDSIEELLLIQGITPDLYFDCGRNNDDIKPAADDNNVRPATLPDLLTVHGDPHGKINVNTARREVIEAVLGAMQVLGTQGGDSVAAADNIIKARLAQPFVNIGDFQSRAGVPIGAAGSLLDVKSNFFRIHGDGRSNNVMVRIEAFVYRNYNPMVMNVVTQSGQPLESYRFLDWRIIR